VLGLLFSAMKTSADVQVHGQVSPSLLRNLAEFMDAWATWKPGKYHRLQITADLEREQPKASGDEAILGFSGGADSAYTAWRHRTGRAGRQGRNLVAGVMLHGFDIPLQETEAFAGAAERAGRMLASLGMELIPVATNFREMGATWEDAHGAGLASALMLLKARYNTGLIASSFDYSALILPWGSNPLTDGLMSSDSFQIVHDGAALHKIEKYREFSQWPEALKYLRVCLDGRSARNCCCCRKCIWALLTFRMLGVAMPECFDHDVSIRKILRLRFDEPGETVFMKALISQARKASVNNSWVRAVQFSLMINRLRSSVMQIAPFRKTLRDVYRFFLPPL